MFWEEASEDEQADAAAAAFVSVGVCIRKVFDRFTTRLPRPVLSLGLGRSPRRAATRSSTRGPPSPTPSAARASATTGTTTPTRSRTSARRAPGRPPPASATARRRGARSSASSTSSGRAGCSTSTCAPPRALRSELCSLCVSLLLNATHTQDRHGCTEALSLARLSRLSESRRLSTGNRPGRATQSCPSPPCPRTPTCRTRCPRRRRRRTG